MKKKLKLGKSVPLREAWQQEDKAYFKTKQRHGESSGTDTRTPSTAPESRPMPLFLADDDSIGGSNAPPALIEPSTSKRASPILPPSDVPPSSGAQASSAVVPMDVSSETPEAPVRAGSSATQNEIPEKCSSTFLAMQQGGETGSHLVLDFEVLESEKRKLESWKHRDKHLE